MARWANSLVKGWLRWGTETTKKRCTFTEPNLCLAKFAFDFFFSRARFFFRVLDFFFSRSIFFSRAQFFFSRARFFFLSSSIFLLDFFLVFLFSWYFSFLCQVHSGVRWKHSLRASTLRYKSNKNHWWKTGERCREPARSFANLKNP